MRHFAAKAFALILATTGFAQAGDYPVVVELYTSQGCSSCPPADKFLHELAKRDDVIPLAFHVDYWDYIGWKDEFANPAHTERQRGYSRMAGSRTIYTPQMVIAGVDHVIGNRPDEATAKIAAHKALPSLVEMSLTREGDTITVDAAAKGRVPKKITLYMIRYSDAETVSISRGENAGRTLTYANVVREWVSIGKWDGAEPLQLTAEAKGDQPVVVLMQTGIHGPILAAARIR